LGGAAVVWGIVAIYLKNRKRKQVSRNPAMSVKYSLGDFQTARARDCQQFVNSHVRDQLIAPEQ
jgi:hypothetical protein